MNNVSPRRLRVLMVNRPNAKTLVGGDLVQMKETASELQKIGVDVSLSHELHPQLGGFDIVHAFNLETPSTTLTQVRHAKKFGKPIVLSTIYWDVGDKLRFASFFELGQWSMIKRVLGKTMSKQVWRAMYSQTKRQEQEILNLVDAILPNSQLEADHLAERFHLPSGQVVKVVTNGIRPEDWPAGDGDRFFNKFGVRDFLLEVGRIDATKNQLTLLKSLRGWPHQVVLIGKGKDSSYLHHCQDEAEGRSVLFLSHLDRQDLADAFTAARVHVLPSFKEVVGLVSLEAAYYGCRIVSTTNGGGREYLQDDAEYCRPDDPADIRRAVERAWNQPPSDPLLQRITTEYTWPRAATQTLSVYHQVLGNSGTM